MAPKSRSNTKQNELLEYRVTELEKELKEHKEENAIAFKEMQKSIQEIRDELIKIVTKIAVAGGLLGAVGTFMLQKIWK